MAYIIKNYIKKGVLKVLQTQKVWFITGTSTGLGRSLAEAVIAKGDIVVATVRKEGTNQDLVEQAPDRVKVVTMDVTNQQQILNAVKEAQKTFGRIDVLVNNAGYGLFGAAEEVSEEQLRQQIETNLIGSILMTKAVLPIMREQKSGHIIQISSIGGQLASPGLSIYHASKWGIEGFCEALATEVAVFGIKVTIIEPGGIRTDWAGRSMVHGPLIEEYAATPVGNMRQLLATLKDNASAGDPNKMADAIINISEREEAPFRLALGTDAYTLLKHYLPIRIEQLEAEKDVTLSTDADDKENTSDEWEQLLTKKK
jgi:NAD(P)-dependent dehydrogenase (short-subunit alcohol dehydrogenase family)